MAQSTARPDVSKGNPSPRAYVLGSGVIGLTTAMRLIEQGYHVSIITRQTHPDTTSSVAAALWFPYKAYPADRVTSWALYSYQQFRRLADDENSGVSMISMRQVCDIPIQTPPWAKAILNFHELGADELPIGYTCGYKITVPMLDTSIYLPWLQDQISASGVEIIVDPKGVSSIEDLGPDQLVFNCTGLGSRDLFADDELFPIKGQVVRTTNPGLVEAVCDDEGTNAVSYVIPRRRDCILGGSAEAGVDNVDVDDSLTASILQRCRKLVPELRDAEILDVRAGLRPGRSAVRVERQALDNGTVVLHNYGHGGSGFTLSWGCVDEAIRLAGINLDAGREKPITR